MPWCGFRLSDKVYIFGWIFMKLTQFVHLINSFNPIDFQKIENQFWKSSHFKLKICISCLRNKVYIFGQIFVKLTQFVHHINSFKPIDFGKKNGTISTGKVAILTHSHTMTPFDAPGKQAFWKHREMEKLLVTSNFSFSHSVFYPYG